MFKFKDFGSLKAPGGVDCNELIDLIGRVVSIYEPKVIQVQQKPKRLIDFVIEDSRESRLSITLWDEHVDSVLPFYDVVITDPLIVILQLCRARLTDDGEVKISSSYTATKILFNYECLEFSSFKERNKNYGKKLQQCEDKMYCTPCNKQWSNGIIKYKLMINIINEDEDGELILWDNVCTLLLGASSSELKVKYSKEGCMPNEIQELIGKTMKFKIVTRHDQFKYGGNVAFTVLGVENDERVCTSVNKGEQGSVVRKLADEKEFKDSSEQLGSRRRSMPKFAQLYIYDTDNEIKYRINSVIRYVNSGDIHENIVEELKNMLDENNVLVKCFRMARTEIQSNPIVEVKMNLIGRWNTNGRTYNLPTANEVAALIVGDLDTSIGDRDILIESQTGQLKRINHLNPAYLPLQYPLLFPYGEDGYYEDITFSSAWSQGHHGGRKRISPKEYFSFYIHEKVNEKHTLLYSRRLFQQYLADAYTMIEHARLVYIRTHQKALRCEAYQGLSDALTRDELDSTTRGKRIILPSSFTGGARYMIQNYQDAMAICRHIGYPHLFIPFTCNPKWPEIERYVAQRGLKAEDRPDIVCRVFKMKLDAMIEEIKTEKLFGDICGVIYTIEFQKRGPPHSHILLFAKRMNQAHSAPKIDALISVEIPDPDADNEYIDAVSEFMLHGPCGQLRKNSPCMVNGKCSKYFPKKYVSQTILDKDGYPIYRRRDNGCTISRNGIQLDNCYVVPHNQHLLLKYRAHINVEWCNQSRSIKYLFKYVNKGNDRVTTEFMSTSVNAVNGDVVDEISMYYDCRYISACEATWRLFGYVIHYRTPPVKMLNFHLKHQQNVVYGEDQSLDEIVESQTVKQSQFTTWFEANKKYEDAQSLTYAEFPSKFVWRQDLREWHQRKKGFSIGRFFYVPPGYGELYYLKCLLNIIRGPSSHEDIRTVGWVIHKSFRDACYEYRLLDDDKEYIDGITESSYWASSSALRRLFATLLTSSSITRPEVVWNAVWQFLAEDAQFHRRRLMHNPDLLLLEYDKQQFALVKLDKLLPLWGKSLSYYPEMLIPEQNSIGMTENMLISEELVYDKESLKAEHETLVTQLTDEQKVVYDSVINDIDSNGGGLFFVYGYEGTAFLLLPGGKKAHSRFAIPLSVNEDSTCNISQGSDLCELIIMNKLIIWDEALMTHKYCFEVLDKTMRDILRFTILGSDQKTVCGKTVVLGGDFR
ncbi:PREDICTED: uncharacterized protein LOC109148663 [Ipomoea nil]|uniref:uncharacterized protein LOC109148663 n=1 Tax=Ipomoea nil TaxID=35883 RepID=UPI000901363A|nr:PREDICTED: uncharacterized protein LOC109148663 [Ipomoea nil]